MHVRVFSCSLFSQICFAQLSGASAANPVTSSAPTAETTEEEYLLVPSETHALTQAPAPVQTPSKALSVIDLMPQNELVSLGALQLQIIYGNYNPARTGLSLIPPAPTVRATFGHVIDTVHFFCVLKHTYPHVTFFLDTSNVNFFSGSVIERSTNGYRAEPCCGVEETDRHDIKSFSFLLNSDFSFKKPTKYLKATKT